MFVANVGPRTGFIQNAISPFVESRAIELDVMSVVIIAARLAKDFPMCLTNMLDWLKKGLHIARYLSTADRQTTIYLNKPPDSSKIEIIKFHSVGKGAKVLKKVLSLQLRASVKLTLSQISAQHIATRTDQYGLPFNVRRLYRTIKCTMLMKNDVALRTSPMSSAMELAHRSLSKSHCGTLLCNTSITAFLFQSRLK